MMWRKLTYRNALYSGKHMLNVCSILSRLFSKTNSVLAESPIHEYAKSGDCSSVEKELKSGVSPDVQDGLKWTPLMLAASQGHVHMMELLIGRGCDLHIRNRTDQTAIELSAFYNQRKAHELLQTETRKSNNSNVTTKKDYNNLKRHNYEEISPLWSGVDRCVSLRSDSARIGELMKSNRSLFIVFYKGWPVVAPDSKSGKPTLLRLHYEKIKPYMDSEQFVFIGLTRDIASNQCYINEDDNESPIYFAVDLAKSEESVLKVLSPSAEILPRLNMISLRGQDSVLMKQARPLLDWHKRHAFCATCSARTILSEAGYKRICTNEKCSTNADVHNTCYPRVDPTVISAVISSDGRRALLARKSIFPPGMFSCLAGFVEPGENLEQACAREISEEVGICVTRVRYHSSQTWPMPSHLMVGFMSCVSDDNQTIKVDETELEEARWFDRYEVVQMQTLQHPDSLFTPPRQAIAHRLIKTWLLETAFK